MSLIDAAYKAISSLKNEAISAGESFPDIDLWISTFEIDRSLRDDSVLINNALHIICKCGIRNSYIGQFLKECELAGLYPSKINQINVTQKEDVLTEAHRLIRGERHKFYGPPTENFARIAGMWSSYLGVDVTDNDVCCLMILLKIARIRTGGAYHRDSAVDAAGYAGILEMLNEPEVK